MFIQIKPIVRSTAAAFFLISLLQAQTPDARSGASALQEHYNAAERLQGAGNLDQASGQYRAFLADAEGELAVGYAEQGNYAEAATLFDEALTLVPNSPTLRLEYARTALALGDVSRAETLAKAFLKDDPGDSKGSAQAHQIIGRALLKLNQDRDARKELELAVALDPTFANGYDLAVACLDLDDNQCAKQLFGEMEASFGDTPAIHMHFGLAYLNSDFQQQAALEFRKVIAESPRAPGAHYALAVALLAMGDDGARLNEAEKELKEEITISPDDASTYAALGKLSMSQHKYVEAERYLKRATFLAPKNPDAFLYLGQMYIDTNQTAYAESCLRQSIRLTTDVSRNRFQVQKAHYLLGRLLMQQHKVEQAHAEMQAAKILLNGDLSQDRSKLAGLLGNGAVAGSVDEANDPAALPAVHGKIENQQAIGRLNAFKNKIAPAIADSYNNLGAIAAMNKDYANALQLFQRASEWNPSLVGLDYNMGRAAFSASRFSDAILPLSRYLRLHEDDSSIRTALGISQYMTQNYSGCIETLQSEDRLQNTIPQTQFVYAESLVKTGKVALGVEQLDLLEKAHPEIADVHSALGEGLEVEGKIKLAIGEFKAAIRINANDPAAYYDLGRAELESGDAEVAISALQSSIRLLPSDPRPHKELASAYKKTLRTADAQKELQIYNTLRASSAQLRQVTK